MKIKALHIVSAVSFVAIAQLLFFWLIPTESGAFFAVYPFYTTLTLAHTALLVFICNKYEYPACFAPAFCGSLVTFGEMAAGLSLGLLCSSIRTIIFVQAIITVVYVLVMAFFCSTASKEAVESTIPATPVRSYSTNSKPAATPIPTAQIEVPRRLPRAVSANDTNR